MQGQFSLFYGIKQGLLVLLQIAHIGCGQSLHQCDEFDLIADDAGSFSADQLQGIGIFFLRHHAAAGGIGVIQAEKTETFRRPDNKIFCYPAQMQHDLRTDVADLTAAIPIRGGIDAVFRRRRKAEPLRQFMTINVKRCTGQSAGA